MNQTLIPKLVSLSQISIHRKCNYNIFTNNPFTKIVSLTLDRDMEKNVGAIARPSCHRQWQ